MFEKNRDSNALAAISKALAANPPPPIQNAPKPVVEQQLPVQVAAAAVVVEKKEKKAKKEPKDKKSSKKEKKVKEHKKQEEIHHKNAAFAQMDVDETALPASKEQPTSPPVVQSAPPMPAPSPTAAALFPTWYLSKVAECFGDEIEALKDADAPVHPKVLMQALASAAPLYSQLEQGAAVGGGGE